MMKKAQKQPSSNALLDQLLTDAKSPEAINDLLKQFTKAIVERALEAEMTNHLAHDRYQPASSSNARNGHSSKALKGELGSYLLMYQEIGIVNLNLKSFPNTKPAGRDLMTK